MDQEIYERARQAFAGEIEVDRESSLFRHRPTGLRLTRSFGRGPHHRTLWIGESVVGTLEWRQQISDDENDVSIEIKQAHFLLEAGLFNKATGLTKSNDEILILSAELLRAYLESDFAMIWGPNPPPRIHISILG